MLLFFVQQLIADCRYMCACDVRELRRKIRPFRMLVFLVH